MKKITIFFLLLVSTNSFAEIITQTQEVSFGEQGSTTNVSLGILNETLSVSAFDTALGVLRDVRITVFGQIDNKGSSKNISDGDGRASVSLMLSQAWQVTTSGADTFVFNQFASTLVSAQSSEPGNYDLITGHAQLDTFNFRLSTDERSGGFTGVDKSAFTTGNDIDFNFRASAITNIQNNVNSGTGYFVNSFETGSWGKVKVEYIYDTDVPEPTTIVILGLGVMGLVLNRKKQV